MIPKIRFTLLLIIAFTTACTYANPSGEREIAQPVETVLETPAPAGIDAAPLAAPALTSIHMLNELNGWGVAETSVVRTNDGGLTWYDLTPPGLADLGYSVSEFFLDRDHAWIVVPDPNDYMRAGALHRTQDGGLNWTESAVPFGGGDLTFLDASNGWMLADLGGGAGSNAVAVYQTEDGGATWTRVYINDPNAQGAGDSLPLGGIKSGLIPLNMQTAWIGGVIYAPGVVYLYRTDNGGRTWAPVAIPLPDGAQESEIDFEGLQFATADNALLAIRMTGDRYQLALYMTQDGGETWALTPTLIPDSGSVDFVSAEAGVVWNGSQFFVTRDAARTWTITPPDVAFGDTFSRMDFVSPDVGWVITYDQTGRYNLYKTTDGGATWISLYR